MDRIEILLLQRELDPAAKRLAEVGVLHLRTMETGKKPSLRKVEGLPGRLDGLRSLESRLSAVMERLGISGTGKGGILPLRPKQWNGFLDQLDSRLSRLGNRVEEVQRQRDRLKDLEILTASLFPRDAAYEDFTDLRKTVFRFGRLNRGDLHALQRNIKPLRTFVLQKKTEQVLAILLTTNEREDDLEEGLHQSHFEDISLPRASGSLPEMERRLRNLREKTELHIRNLSARSFALKERNRNRLQSWLRSVRAEILLLEARDEFGYTERVVVLGGWVPRKRFGEMRQALEEVCGRHQMILRHRATEDETPVDVENPRLLRPFQKMLAVYGTPTYRELEPTPLLAFGFILLFGMMFGDVGHGLVFLAVGWALRRYTKWRDEGLIVMEVGGCAVLFGILFGSVFGNEELFPPLWFSPMHNIPLLMGVSLTLGVALIVSGLGLRIYNGWKKGQKGAVLTGKNGVAGLIFYTGAIATGVLFWRDLLPGSALLWLVLPLAGVFMHPFFGTTEKKPVAMAVAEGIVEVMETVLGYLANTFSFLRVAAFGLAHVGLLMAVFALADYVGTLPLGDLWVILVHVTGNLIILVLEGLVVSVQTVRLEFYEFFSKFFQGEGVAYRPLALDPGIERGG